jgi:outer membrane protein OmpU
MKKVLLATTILGMTAGFATAEIAFTGEATAGFAKTGAGSLEGDSGFQSYQSFTLSVAATGETDSGLAFGASTSFSAGKSFDFDGVDSSFLDNDEEDYVYYDWDNSGIMGRPEVFISGDFGRIAFSHNGYDDLANDSFDDNDVSYTHSIAGLDIAVAADVAGDFEGDGGGSEGTGEVSVQLGYTVSGISFEAAVDGSDDSSRFAVESTFGPITAGLTYEDDQDDGGTATQVATLDLEYSADAITVGVELSDDDTWSASAGYSANGLSLDAETNQDDEWVVTGSYDLGGGLTAEAGTDSFESVYVGAVMKF